MHAGPAQARLYGRTGNRYHRAVRAFPYYMVALLLGCTSPALAASFGSVGALLMAEGLAVRPLGLGGAYVAMADDESSLQTDPAGLARLQGLTLSGGHVLGLLEDRLSYLDLGWQLGEGRGLGLQAAYFGGDDQGRDEAGNVTGGIHSRQLLLGAAAGWQLPHGWRLGLGVKGLQEDNAGATSLSLAGDLGLQADLPRGWSAGLAVTNAGRQLDAPQGQSALSTPLRVQAGVCAPFLSPLWQLEADVQVLPLEGQTRLLLGSELAFDVPGMPGRAALRFGGQGGLQQEEGLRLSLGAGYRWAEGPALDYALQSLGALGQTHRFSLSLRFSQPTHAVLPASSLSAPYGLTVVPQLDGLLLGWSDSNENATGYNLYSDYGVVVERLNEKPVKGTAQKFVKVTRSSTYHFYVRPVGPDGKEGPPSEIKTVRVK